MPTDASVINDVPASTGYALETSNVLSAYANKRTFIK